MRLVAAFAVMLLLHAGIAAANTYRWVDQHGNVVIGDTVPPGQARHGYEVIDPRTGRVIRVVDRAKTDEERQAEREAERLREAEDEALARQRQRDEMLLQLYSDEAALRETWDTRITEVEQRIEVTRRVLRREQDQRRELLAEVEAGNGDPQDLVRLDELNDRIQMRREAIREMELEYQRVNDRFRTDLERIKELRGR